MLNFGAMVAVPIAIPIILCMFVKKTPDWAGWSCALIGIPVSFVIKHYIGADWFQDLIQHDLSLREEKDYVYVITVILNVSLVTAWFFMTKLFYKGHSEERQAEMDEFWGNIHREVKADETTSELDGPQCRIIGWMASVFGAFMLLLMIIIPNDLAGRGSFLFCGGSLGIIGFLLLQSAKKADLRHAAKTNNSPPQ